VTQARDAQTDQPPREIPPRVARARAHLDLTTGRGLEVGPLYAPMVARGEADVRYVDVHAAPGLRAFYQTHPGVPVDDIVDVDFALTAEDGTMRGLAAAAAPAAPYDWVLASHVIEHVPDLIGWLAEVAEVLADEGRLALVIPDRRYCFDVLRPGTTVGEMLLAHEQGDTRPSVRAVFDHYSTVVSTSAAELWRGAVPGPDDLIHDLDFVLEQVRRSGGGEYVDCHVWLFTPDSFVAQLRTLARLGRIDFTVHAVSSTGLDDLEFFVTLRRLPRGLSDADRAAAIEGGFPPVPDVPAPRRPVAALPAAGDQVLADQDFVLSAREVRLIQAKRKVINKALGRPEQPGPEQG
jgi:hypothetical protein